MALETLISTDEVLHQRMQNIDVTPLVTRFAKEGKSHSQTYRIQSEKRRNTSIAYDTPNGIELYFDGETHPLAMIGYKLYTIGSFENIPVVEQIQARRIDDTKSLEALQNIKWERMLLSVFENTAKELAIPSIGILPAEENYWYEVQWDGIGPYPKRTELEDHQERMRMRYNATAKRLGYKYDSASRLFVKRI